MFESYIEAVPTRVLIPTSNLSIDLPIDHARDYISIKNLDIQNRIRYLPITIIFGIIIFPTLYVLIHCKFIYTVFTKYSKLYLFTAKLKYNR